MGQNQDKPEGEQEVLEEGLEETKSCHDSGGVGSHQDDVMEGEGSFEEEAGYADEKSGEPDTQDLDQSPSKEPTTPLSEKQTHLWENPSAAKEVRQGGAAGKEGGGGGGGGGDSTTAPLVPQETDKNYKSSLRLKESVSVHKCFSPVKREEKKSEEQPGASSKAKMDYLTEKTFLQEEDQDEDSEDVSCFDEQSSVIPKNSRCGTHAKRRLLHVEDLNKTMIAELQNEHIKVCAGTEGRLKQRKEPPPAQAKHPLKNILQGESSLNESGIIHFKPPKEETQYDDKEEMQTRDVKPVLNDSLFTKVTAIDDREKSMKPDSRIDTTEAGINETTALDSASYPVSSIEPSSILEKLLKRSRKETNPSISEPTEIDSCSVGTTDIHGETHQKITHDIHTSATFSERTDHSSCDQKKITSSADLKQYKTIDQHNKDLDLREKVTASSTTSDLQHFTTTENINCTNPSVREHDVELRTQGPSTRVCSGDLQSAVSHERKSCEVSGVISEESSSSSLFEAKLPPTKSDGQIPHSDSITLEKTDGGRGRSPLQNQTDPPLSGTEKVAQATWRSMVKVAPEDTAARAGNAGLVISEEGHKVPASMNPNLTVNTTDQSESQAGQERHDSVARRDKSQSTPKPRPVSELIKETIQLHEKLQHQDRPKPVEVKLDEQSVKVAQMKAAFDSAQKSPDKAVERKTSMRRDEKRNPKKHRYGPVFLPSPVNKPLF